METIISEKIKHEVLDVFMVEPAYITFVEHDCKRLQIMVGGGYFRVLHGQEIVYIGSNQFTAVRTYNELQGEPKDVPKTDN